MRIRSQYFPSEEPRDPGVLLGLCQAGKAKKLAVSGLHTQVAHRFQCDAEEWNAVAGGGESASLILRQWLRLAPRTDASIILQDGTPSGLFIPGNRPIRILG